MASVSTDKSGNKNVPQKNVSRGMVLVFLYAIKNFKYLSTYPMYHYSELRNPSALLLFLNVMTDDEHKVQEDVT